MPEASKIKHRTLVLCHNNHRIRALLGRAILIGTVCAVAAPAAQAQNAMTAQGGLLATGGVTSISGVAGGGINPFAMIAGYDTNDQIGATGFYTHIIAGSYTLNAGGAAVGLFDRVEISVARQNFDLGTPGASLGLGSNFNLSQNIFSAKVRLFGNAVYDQNSLEPVVSVGASYHENVTSAFPGTNIPLPKAVGSHLDGTSFYIDATKLFIDGLFGHYTLLNAGLRLTNSNYNGLLGFGGTNSVGQFKSGYHVEPFFSFAYFPDRKVALGYEFRAMPHFDVAGALNLNTTNNWQDVFVAYFPTKNLSITAAYAALGTIAGAKNSNGLYLSLTATF
jgi:hypothetical protein